MEALAHRYQLARFIDSALTPQVWRGRTIAAVPIPRTVLSRCADTMRGIADALRDERRAVDAQTLADLEHVLTRGASSPLYDGGHPIRALHTLTAIESRFGDLRTR